MCSIVLRAKPFTGTRCGSGSSAAKPPQQFVFRRGSLAFSEDLHTQIAVLNKINGANVLALRISEATNQLQMHTLEQLLIQNKRARDAEAHPMNARLFHWRLGAEYARALFANRGWPRLMAPTLTGESLWRQPNPSASRRHTASVKDEQQVLAGRGRCSRWVRHTRAASDGAP